jgi:hypothetical protein
MQPITALMLAEGWRFPQNYCAEGGETAVCKLVTVLLPLPATTFGLCINDRAIAHSEQRLRRSP